MTRHRGRERRTFFDVLSHLEQGLLKVLVVLLLGQDLETLDQRQTGVDHHGKLARKDRQVFRLDLFAAANLRNADLAALLFNRSQGHLLTPQNLAQGFAIIRDSFADNDLVQSVGPEDRGSRVASWRWR